MASQNFPVHDFRTMKRKLLCWLQQFEVFCFLDNHQYQFQPHSVECLAGVGVKRMIQADPLISLHELQNFIDEKPAWLFGHLSYDLKNEIEGLTSQHPDFIRFPHFFFYEPQILVQLNESQIVIEGVSPEEIFRSIVSGKQRFSESPDKKFQFKNRIEKEEYCAIIERLKQHIHRGDCYEINFCQEFFAEDIEIDPIRVYEGLSHLSPNPFSALYKLWNNYLLCSSPERFLKKSGKKILSQPIKGTSRRFHEDEKLNIESKESLVRSQKEKSENVMVVDLVRNDLSKICEEGSVKVDELFGIYTFPQVHQMISTISGVLRENISFKDTIRAMFPMGSMTGAPKRNVLKLIEQYEKSRRGIFSGALGYITPVGDFDFNVVIRSIMYNASARYLSIQAGSGITFYCDPEKEYEECLLKAQSLKKVFENK